MPQPALTPELADRFAAIALGHVTREYPNKLDHVLTVESDALGPRALHPIFYGSFDWHSCVHGYWMLARLLRRSPGATADRIRALFDTAFTEENVAGERAYLARPSSAGFERPYGWAWLLKLAEELSHAENPAWALALDPLAEAFADRLRGFLPKADYPIRNGSHANTAFALTLSLEYARACGHPDLAAAIEAKAIAWYGRDRDCPAWEPSGDDFLSPALVEALLLARALPRADFRPWLAAFLPRLASGEPATLFTPVRVSDRADGKIAHLDGLNLSRAWCWRALARHLDDAARIAATEAAERHLAAGLPHVAGDYMGEHWLATYAVLALDSEG